MFKFAAAAAGTDWVSASAAANPPAASLAVPGTPSVDGSSAASALDSMVAINATPDQQGNKDNKGKANKSKGDCIACDEPRHNSCWCKRHTRGYECICKNATSPKGMQNRKDPSNAVPDPEAANAIKGSEYHAFIMICWDDKERRAGFRQPTLAIKCVVTFCSNHPAGVEQRKKRGFNVSLIQFLQNSEVHQVVTRRFQVRACLTLKSS